MSEKIDDDIETVCEAMDLFMFKRKSFFSIQNVIIDDIICEIHFRYESVNNEDEIIFIDIYNDKILDKCFDTISLFSVKLSYKINSHSKISMCKLALEEMLELIPTLKFDCLIGRFLPTVSLHRQNSRLFEATKRIFHNIGIKIQDTSETCIVCYENTNCITSCNHALCFVCCSKVVETLPEQEVDEDEDDEIESIVRCPMCRAVCNYKRGGGCDYP